MLPPCLSCQPRPAHSSRCPSCLDSRCTCLLPAPGTGLAPTAGPLHWLAAPSALYTTPTSSLVCACDSSLLLREAFLDPCCKPPCPQPDILHLCYPVMEFSDHLLLHCYLVDLFSSLCIVTCVREDGSPLFPAVLLEPSTEPGTR